MSEAFEPLAPLVNTANGDSFMPLDFKGRERSGNDAPHPVNGTASAIRSKPACAEPKITLQRQGEIVTAIRIECSCGQVIELNCAY